MKVFCSPVGTFSMAMVRISNALKRYAPAHVTFVNDESQADLVVMYVIGFDYVAHATRLKAEGKSYAVVQCCVESTENTVQSEWWEFWEQAELVWSYLQLKQSTHGFNFMYAPLGLDDAFVEQPLITPPRRNLIVTSGYVTGQSAESIAEVWEAANRLNIEAVHVGPPTVEGMSQPRNWRSIQPTDTELAKLYRVARWVSGLRRKEGFELFAAEAAACGAVPIVFNQPSQCDWYCGIAEFVDDCGGEELVERLCDVFTHYQPARSYMIDEAKQRFSWERVCTQFWRQLEIGRRSTITTAGTKEPTYAD